MSGLQMSLYSFDVGRYLLVIEVSVKSALGKLMSHYPCKADGCHLFLILSISLIVQYDQSNIV